MKPSSFLLLAPLAALLLATGPVSHASTVNATFYEADTFFGFPVMSDLDIFGNLSEALPTYGIANQESFTVSNSNAADLFSFYLGPQSNDIDLSGFLTAGKGVVGGSDGHSVTASTTNPGGLTLGTNSIDNGVFDFTGSTYLAAGTYNFYSDDGMFLCINASTSNCLGGGPGTIQLIQSGNAQSASDHQFTITAGEAGDYDFNLLYAESNGAPAELEGNLGTLAPMPEPGSLALLGTGILAAAGMIRRRVIA